MTHRSNSTFELQRKIKLGAVVAALATMIVAGAVVATPAAAQDGETPAEMDGTGAEDDPYVVTNAEELQAMNEDLDAHYVLGNDIDASETAEWNARSGFVPVGDEPEYGERSRTPFTGSFNGQGHTITGLTIARPTSENIGLFGYSEGLIENVRLEEINVRGEEPAGGLVGENFGSVSDVAIEGEVRGSPLSIGGLAGANNGDIHNASVDVTVTSSGTDNLISGTGGIAGYNGGELTESTASGDVSGAENIGGLVGVNSGTVMESGATGDVSGDEVVGGLVGNAYEGAVSDSYATGDVSAEEIAGGLAGENSEESTIRTSYATGDVSATENAGGLIGSNVAPVGRSFATGTVEAGTNAGGLVGTGDTQQVTDAYWSPHAANQNDVLGDEDGDAVRLGRNDLTGADATSNLNALDFDDVYAATDEHPILRWQVEDADVALDDATITEEQQTDVAVTLSLTDGTTVTASEVAEYDADAAIASVDAGTLTAESKGETDVSATVAGQSDTATLDVLEPPEISQTDAGIDAEGVVNGSTATITASYENTGGMEGDHTAELVVDGETVDTETVTVGLDAEETVEFEFTPDEAGDYDIAVDGTDVGTLAAVERGTVSVTGVDAPEQIGEGTPYEIDVTLSNDADVTVAETVTYQVDGEDAVTESVAVDADGATATLEHAVDATGSVDHRVAVADTEATASSEVVEPPAFEVAELDAPDAVEAGETAELAATIENSGGIEHTRTVTVRYGGENVTATDVTLAPGESTEVTGEVTADEAGDVSYAASVADASQEGAVTVEESAQNGNGDDGSPGFGVVAALAALLGGAAASRRRR